MTQDKLLQALESWRASLSDRSESDLSPEEMDLLNEADIALKTPAAPAKAEALEAARLSAIYSDVVTIPIPVYEQMKTALQQAAQPKAHGVWTPEMKSAAMRDASEVCRLTDAAKSVRDIVLEIFESEEIMTGATLYRKLEKIVLVLGQPALKTENAQPVDRSMERMDMHHELQSQAPSVVKPPLGNAPKWVNCPICHEPDMRMSTTAEGETLIHCVNHGCRSNTVAPSVDDAERKAIEHYLDMNEKSAKTLIEADHIRHPMRGLIQNNLKVYSHIRALLSGTAKKVGE